MKSNPYIYLFKKRRNYAERKYMIILIISFFIISNITNIISPWVFGQLINTLQQGIGDGAIHDAVKRLIILGVLPLVDWIFHGTARVRENKLAFQVGKSFKNQLFYFITSLPLAWHNDHHSGETIDQFNKASDALRSFAGDNFMYIGTIMRYVSSIIAMIWIWPLGGSIVGIVGIGIFAIVRRFDMTLIPSQKKQNSLEHKISGILFDYLSNIKTIITLRCEKLMGLTLSKSIESVRKPYEKYITINEWKWFTVSIILSIVTSITIGAFLYKQVSLGQEVLIGTITMLYQYIQRLSGSFYNFARQYSEVVRRKNDFETVEHIISHYESLDQQGGEKLLHHWDQININNLQFKYQNTNKDNTLMGIDISWSKGQKIALVGASGSGKSTLMMLLRGLYDVDKVSLKINNGPDYTTLYPLSHISSLIPQDPEIFENTIRYNITMGIDLEDSEVLTYAKMASFENVISGLPNGLDTDIKEKGVNLSGGQKQRLALARGLLLAQDSDILLLDEPTSSVDSISEKHIYHEIFSHFQDKTVFASVHRLHMLDMFDMIYVLDKGSIVESGDLNHLINKQGLFTKLWDDYTQSLK